MFLGSWRSLGGEFENGSPVSHNENDTNNIGAGNRNTGKDSPQRNSGQNGYKNGFTKKRSHSDGSGSNEKKKSINTGSFSKHVNNIMFMSPPGAKMKQRQNQNEEGKMPWSLLHELLFSAAEEYGNHVAYTLRISDTNNGSAQEETNKIRFEYDLTDMDTDDDTENDATVSYSDDDDDDIEMDDPFIFEEVENSSIAKDEAITSNTNADLRYERGNLESSRPGLEYVEYSTQDRAIKMSYRDVYNRISLVANALKNIGVKSSDRVGIMLPNCPEYFELYFAISKASAISVQLNPRLAAPELRGVLHDSQCKIIFAASEFDLLNLLVDVDLSQNTYVKGISWVKTVDGWKSSNAVSFNGVAGIKYGQTWCNQNGNLGDVSQYSYDDMATLPGHYWENQMSESRVSVPEASPALDDATEASVATLFYTSGTTGVPKGVMLTHLNVLYHALRTRETLGWRHPSEIADKSNSLVWGHFAPMFHVGDAWAVFATTEVGGRHVFCPRFEVNNILTLIEKESVQYTKIVPTMLHLIVHSPQLRKVDISSLKMVVSGGAPLHESVVEKTMRNMSCDLLQDYGMTECSCHITLGDPPEEALLPLKEKLSRKVKAGKVFKGMQVKVVDPDWEPERERELAGGLTPPSSMVRQSDPPSLKINEVGELWVRGDNLFVGYWRRPDETERVMHNGWFRTGDLGSIDEHGYISVSDRKKDMIISAGENIFSIEVETVLRNHPKVAAAAVYGVPNDLLGEVVHAAVTLNSRSQNRMDLIQELKQLCQNDLAPYKIPRSIEVVDDFPRGPTGKIQKHILRRLAKERRRR